MNRRWLILDCNYLCHRAKHSTGGLSHNNKPTGVIYGFLKSIQALQEQFNTADIVFCWDSKTSKREKVYPDYKAQRKDKYKDMSDEELEFEKEFRLQMKLLRIRYLKTIGYKNVLVQPGYESDDIIASICKWLDNEDEAIIITSDKDLYQCIKHNVSFFDPSKGKRTTLQGFKKKYGISPTDWAKVKSIAGCVTDNVSGIQGVGEKTAIKYIQDKLKRDSKTYLKIIKNEFFTCMENDVLVKLPFKGTKRFELQEDEISKTGWRKVTKALGMNSIRDKAPTTNKRKRKGLL